MKTVLSGIRSTGHLHLGNYFGALKNFTQLQYKANCYFLLQICIHLPHTLSRMTTAKT